MSLASLDRILGMVVILLGVMQVASTFHFFRQIEEPAAWFLAGVLLLMLCGALTLLRLRYGDVAPGVKSVATVASVGLAIFWIALYWALFEKFARTPASFTGLFVIVASAVVALLGLRRARSPHS